MVISSRQKLQSLNDYTMNVHIEGVPINQSNQRKLNLSGLSLMKISRERPTLMKSLKVSSGIGALKKRVRPFVPKHTAIKIYKGLIEPHFNHRSTVWDHLTQQLRRNFKNFKIVLSELSPNNNNNNANSNNNNNNNNMFKQDEHFSYKNCYQYGSCIKINE